MIANSRSSSRVAEKVIHRTTASDAPVRAIRRMLRKSTRFHAMRNRMPAIAARGR